MDGRLSRFCLLFAVHVGDERDMNECEVFVADSELELTHGFDEWGGFNVTDSTPKLKKQWATFHPPIVIRMLSRNKRQEEHTSTMQTSGSSPVSSTGTLETRSIQSWIAFVTCGTICAPPFRADERAETGHTHLDGLAQVVSPSL